MDALDIAVKPLIDDLSVYQPQLLRCRQSMKQFLPVGVISRCASLYPIGCMGIANPHSLLAPNLSNVLICDY